MSETHVLDKVDDPDDAAVARAELRIAVLQEVTQICLRLARNVEAAALADNGPDGDPGKAAAKDPVETIARLSRAIRLTVTLESKADEALYALRAGIVIERKARAEVPWSGQERGRAMTQLDLDRHKRRVRELVIDAIETETPDQERRVEITAALDERLRADMAYWGMHDWPMREIVEHMCSDLCLNPNWKRWNDDRWGQERFWRLPEAPFQQPRQTPYWFDQATPQERRKRLGLE